MDELVCLIKDDSGIFKFKVNNIQNHMGKSGVWAMFGRLNPNDEYICLEVGQSSDIYEELNYDITYLIKDYSNIYIEKRYTARRLFKEFNTTFDVCACDLNRTNAKYRIIATAISDIKIMLISEQKDKNVREEIELKFAVENKARFWNAWGKQRRMAREYYKTIPCQKLK